MDELEIRSVPFEMRSSDDGRTLSGYAAVFDSPTQIRERGQDFIEQIAHGTFAETINARDRVVMQFDHGQHPFIGGFPLGKITALREDDHGLFVEARLSDNTFGEIVRTAVADEAITGMSFRFSVPEGGDVWDRTGDMPTRTVNEVKLYELGPVTFPAYDTTTVGVRSAVRLLEPDALSALLDELRGTPTPDEGSATSTPDEGSMTPDERDATLRSLYLERVL